MIKFILTAYVAYVLAAMFTDIIVLDPTVNDWNAGMTYIVLLGFFTVVHWGATIVMMFWMGKVVKEYMR